jgi:hypothetical protein
MVTFITLSILIVSIPIMMPFAKADQATESYQVFTNPQTYEVGDNVTILAQALSLNPGNVITITDVVVYDPNGAVAAEWHNQTIVLPDTQTIVTVGTMTPQVAGNYSIDCNATGCPTIIRFFLPFFCYVKPKNYVPEVPTGTIDAVLAAVAAAGLYVTKKKWPKK